MTVKGGLSCSDLLHTDCQSPPANEVLHTSRLFETAKECNKAAPRTPHPQVVAGLST